MVRPSVLAVPGRAVREEVALSRLRLPLKQQKATTSRMDGAMHGTRRRDMKITFGQAMVVERDVALEHDAMLGLIMGMIAHLPAGLYPQQRRACRRDGIDLKILDLDARLEPNPGASALVRRPRSRRRKTQPARDHLPIGGIGLFRFGTGVDGCQTVLPPLDLDPQQLVRLELPQKSAALLTFERTQGVNRCTQIGITVHGNPGIL